MLNYDISYYIEKYKRPIKWSVISLLSAILLYFIVSTIISIITNQGKISVPLQVVPNDAQITIDGSLSAHPNTVHLTPGDHTVKVEKDGFRTVEKTYRIYDYNAPAIYIALVGTSDEAIAWQQAHQIEYRNLEILTTNQAHDYTKKFEERNPIVKDLPIKDPYFTISYRNIDDKTITLTIWGTSPRYREFAIDYLRQKGYEPTDYIIEFTDFANPLAQKGPEK